MLKKRKKYENKQQKKITINLCVLTIYIHNKYIRHKCLRSIYLNRCFVFVCILLLLMLLYGVALSGAFVNYLLNWIFVNRLFSCLKFNYLDYSSKKTIDACESFGFYYQFFSNVLNSNCFHREICFVIFYFRSHFRIEFTRRRIHGLTVNFLFEITIFVKQWIWFLPVFNRRIFINMWIKLLLVVVRVCCFFLQKKINT